MDYLGNELLSRGVRYSSLCITVFTLRLKEQAVDIVYTSVLLKDMTPDLLGFNTTD